MKKKAKYIKGDPWRLDGGWNYRVVKEGNLLTIREVYYEKGKPVSWSSDPIYPSETTTSELFCDLIFMLNAVTKPVLVVRNNKLYEEKAKAKKRTR